MLRSISSRENWLTSRPSTTRYSVGGSHRERRRHAFGVPYQPSEKTAIEVQSPSAVPSTQSLTESTAALAAEAALEAPRASMIAAPLC